MIIKHRHYLAAPLFLLMLLVTVFGAFGAPRAQVIIEDRAAAGMIRAVGADQPFSLPRGVQGILQEDGVLRDDGEELTLEEGTILIASERFVALRVSESMLSGFHGAFLLSRGASTFSVLALTTPVLLTHGGFRVIIPQGMQGSFSQEDLPVVGTDLAAIADVRSTLRMIPPATEREQRQAIMALSLQAAAIPLGRELESLQEAIIAGDLQTAHLHMSNPSVQAILASMDLPPTALPVLIAAAAEFPSIQQELLEHVRDSDLWLLLSFHPAFRSAAWETSGPLGIPADARALRWLQLPSSDVAEAVPALAVDRWTGQVRKYLESSEHPAKFLEPLLHALQGYWAFAEASGFPERLERYTRALQTLVDPWKDHLSEEAASLYAEWRQQDVLAPYKEPAPLPSGTEISGPTISVLSETPPAPFDATAVEAHAKQLLLGIGALFTTQTVLHAEDALHVKVQNLLFASPSGEHYYELTVDLSRNECTSIQRDGQPLPYALSAEAFGAWAGGR